jgi:hypothetical protein
VSDVSRNGSPTCASRLPLLVFAAALVIYLANGRSIPSADTVPARLLPASILSEGDFDLDEFSFLYEGGRPYFLQHVHGRYVSSYPVGAALAALPFFAPLVAADVDPRSDLYVAAEKLAAATMVALSAAVLLLGLREIVPARIAFWLTVAYALGTSSFSQSSQALWQHGPAQLAIATGLYGALRSRVDRRWLAATGFALGFAVVCRPGDALIVAPIVAYLLARHRRSIAILALLAALAAPLAFQLAYNATYFDDASRLQFSLLDSGGWSTPLLTGLAGVLLSPGRGLLVYSPIFVLAPIGGVLAWRRPGDPLLRWLAFSVVASLVLNARWIMWWGGTCYGPRLLADLTPVLVFLMVPIAMILERSRIGAVVFAALLAWSIGMHAIGAFCTDLGWNDRRDIDRHPERLWSWTDNQPVECVRAAVTLAAGD